MAVVVMVVAVVVVAVVVMVVAVVVVAVVVAVVAVVLPLWCLLLFFKSDVLNVVLLTNKRTRT